MGKMPKELSDFFKRRKHAFGSKRHWKKRFLRGDDIGRYVIEDMSRTMGQKLVRWIESHGGVYAANYDGWIKKEN